MYKCPKCKNSDLTVDAIVDGAVDMNGNLEILGSNARFDSSSLMFCCVCGWSARASEFCFSSPPSPAAVAYRRQKDAEDPAWSEIQRRLGFGPKDQLPPLGDEAGKGVS